MLQVKTLNSGDDLGQRKDSAAGVYANRLDEDLKRQFAVLSPDVPSDPVLRLRFGRELSCPLSTAVRPSLAIPWAPLLSFFPLLRLWVSLRL